MLVSPTSLFIFFMQLETILSQSMFSTMTGYKYFSVVTYVLSIICILIKIFSSKIKMSLLKLVLIVVTCLFILIGFLNAGGMLIVKTVLFAIAVYKTSGEKVLKSYYDSTRTGVLFVVVCSLFYDGSHISKYLLGFLNQNALGMNVFNIAMLYIVINYNSKIKKCVIYSIIACVLCFMVESYSSAVCMIIAIGLIVTIRFWKEIKIFCLAIENSFAIITLLSIALGISYTADNVVLNMLNAFLSTRLYCWNRYFMEKPIALFGVDFELSQFLALDNGALYLLFRHGIILLVIYVFMFKKIAGNVIKDDRWGLVIAYISYVVYSFMEYGAIDINNNFVLAVFFADYFGETLSNKKQG